MVAKEPAINLLTKWMHRFHSGEIWLESHTIADAMGAVFKSFKCGAASEKRHLGKREMEVVQLIA